MNLGDKYITFKDIQETIVFHHTTFNEGLGFRDAVMELWRQNIYLCGDAPKPNFSSWDLSDYHAFLDLVNQIPIYYSEIFNVVPQFNKEHNSTYLPTIRPVQICLESYYAPKKFGMYDYFTVIYVLNGCSTLYFKTEKHHLTTGELCMIAPNTPHCVYTEPGNLIINIMSDSKHFEDNFFQLIDKKNILSDFFRKALYQSHKYYLLFLIPPSMEVNMIIQQLFKEVISGEEYSTEVFNNYLQIFYAHIIRSYNNTYLYYEAEHKTSPTTVIPAILHHIALHYRTLSLETLAEKFHYNSAYLSKLIKNSTGKTYITIINQLKIDEACLLLRTTNKKVDQIADMVGYHSSDHFYHAFKQITNLSPTAYRKEALL